MGDMGDTGNTKAIQNHSIIKQELARLLIEKNTIFVIGDIREYRQIITALSVDCEEVTDQVFILNANLAERIDYVLFDFKNSLWLKRLE